MENGSTNGNRPEEHPGPAADEDGRDRRELRGAAGETHPVRDEQDGADEISDLEDNPKQAHARVED